MTTGPRTEARAEQAHRQRTHATVAGEMVRLAWVRWRRLLIPVALAANLALVLHTVYQLGIRYGGPTDWIFIWQPAASQLAAGTLYSGPTGVFVWSPLAAWLLAHVVLPLGYPVLVAAHFAALLALRNRHLALLVAISWPFWVDLVPGNFFVFVAISGFLALRGSRLAALAFFALCMLMPRPVQFPLAVWLLWHDRALVLPVAAMATASIGIVGLTGYGDDWIRTMITIGRDYPYRAWDLGPSRILGAWWLLVGIPLGVWLTLKGRVGLAGLAVSPYLVPQYLLMLLIELPSGREGRLGAEASRDPLAP